MKSTLGWVLILGAVGVYFLSNAWESKLLAQKQHLMEAQQKMSDEAPELIERPRNRIRDAKQSSAMQQNVSSAQATIAEYQQIVTLMRMGSVVALVAGLGLIFVGSKKSRS
ncbi:MAG: hypothetical protein EBZ47_04110 [Chlamydiae bacterium]|nr:hypothetical protein [Chlamydiota bacterium]